MNDPDRRFRARETKKGRVRVFGQRLIPNIRDWVDAERHTQDARRIVRQNGWNFF
jgi:hypothetical protein